ncbi:hypothetical protein DL762_002102 [Monosporascus cannonballus]|uniref:Cytochrome P450 n=1 Tax=Monosporascus cannonballus TaxID=155416 RepID=A0ABY0HEJ8_9PEZI|nr:hypothetical protein DL762_002102 [Monosporascus cannonballus]
MPSIPWRAISLISLASAYVFVSRERQWSAWQLLSTFATTWAFQVVCWAVWAVLLWPRYFSPLRDLPEPSGNSFLFGQFHRIRTEPSGVPHREWAKTIPNDGLIRYLGPFNQERLLVTNPKTLSEVLVTRSYDFVKPADVQYALSRILGVGVLVAEGGEHRFQRKMLMPAFAFRHVKDLYPVFWDKGREVVEAMAEHIIVRGSSSSSSPPPEQTDPERKGGRNSAVIEVGDWASRATLDIIGVAGLGKDFGAIRDPDTELSRTYRSLFSPSKQAWRLAVLTLLLPNWLVARIPVKRNDDITSAAGYIRSVCRDLIREKREKMQAALNSGAGKEGKPAGAGAAPDVDILSVALESGAFSDENLVDQLMTFLAAGHETTATAMTWAVYLLARHPDVQSRLRREVREHLPSPAAGAADPDSATVSSAEIDRLPYLNAVCSEVLRHFAPVPLTLREAGPGATIRGRRVPAGTRVVLAPWATNRDPALWGEDADEFRPERWLQGQGQGQGQGGRTTTADDRDHHDGAAEGKRHGSGGGASSNYAFLTFLHGPRSCIGQAFARAEFACLLACWVGRFEFALRDEAERDERNISIKGGATAKPETGMYVHATLVDGW